MRHGRGRLRLAVRYQRQRRTARSVLNRVQRRSQTFHRRQHQTRKNTDETIQIDLITVACLLLQGGCQTTKDIATPANVGISTGLLCSGVLMSAPANKQAEIAAYMYSTATALRTLAGGTVPTVEQMRETLATFTPESAKWADLAVALSSVWSGVLPQLHGNVALAAAYIEAMASHAESAAQPYLGK